MDPWLNQMLAALSTQGQGNPQLQDLQDMPEPASMEQIKQGVGGAVAGIPGGARDMFESVSALGSMAQGTPYPIAAQQLEEGMAAPGGTDWFGEQMGMDPQSAEFMAGSMVSPDPFGKIGAGVGLAMGAIGKMGKKGDEIVDALMGATKYQAADYVAKPTKGHKNMFTEAQHEARAAMGDKDAAQVDLFNPDEFEGQVYLSDDGMSGFSMTKEGYVGHVFRHPDAPKNGALSAAMTKARADGAKNLEAFDTYLVDQYKKSGAVETERHGWDPQYATEEIAEALGEDSPDFVEMDIGGVFPERKHSELVGPAPQASFLRKRMTPGGKEIQRPKSLDAVITPENKERIMGLVQKGIERGGDKWYHTGGIKDAFIEQLGPEEGTRRFDMFMDYGAALSPRSKVEQQLKRASVMMKRELEGEDVSTLSHEMFPEGYGHMATQTAQKPAMERLAATGAVGDPTEQPKIASYAANQKGNYAPLTADTHNFEILSGMKRSPSANEYAFIEDWQREIAHEMDLDPAEFQAALWVGADEITGVADSRNLTAAMNQRIAATAEKHGISEEEALEKFIEGEVLLNMLMGTGAGGAAGSMFYGNDEVAGMA